MLEREGIHMNHKKLYRRVLPGCLVTGEGVLAWCGPAVVSRVWSFHNRNASERAWRQDIEESL